MKNFLKFLNIENLKENLKKIIYRFPLWIIVILLVTILFFINLHWNLNNEETETIAKIIFSLCVVFFFSLWVYISCENNNINTLKRNVLQIIPFIFWILLYNNFTTNLDNFENIIYIILSSGWILFYLFFAPYIKNIFLNNLKQSIFYTYFYNISVIFLISFILWGVLFTLWSIWISAIFELFDIREYITNDIYWDWAIIALSFITPIFALTQIPNKESFNENYFNENAFFSFLIKYIVIPFIYIYFIILYAYTIKVLINFGDWPKWEVSWMVIWFSIFWYLAYIFSYIFEDTNKSIKLFRKGFPYVVIPQIWMLFYAIYLRINQYDITVNRYFVVVFGLWLLSISIYYIFSKKKSLSLIPFLLTVFTIIISIWPWWVYQLPQSRQLSKLQNNLTQAWILNNWEIIPLNNYEDIDWKLSENIYSWISYLCDFDNCNSIKKLFSKIYSEIEKEDIEIFNKSKTDNLERYKNDPENLKYFEELVYQWMNKWTIVDKITTQIKVSNYNNKFDETQNPTLYFDLNNNETIFPIDISWFSKIIRINQDSIKNVYDSSYAKIDIEKEIIEIIENWEIKDTISLNDFFTKLTEKSNLSKQDLTFENNSNWKNYKIFFESISIKNPKYTWTDIWYYYANGYVLVK